MRHCLKVSVLFLSALVFVTTTLTAWQYVVSTYTARYRRQQTAANARIQKIESYNPLDYPPLPPQPSSLVGGDECPIDPLSTERRPPIRVHQNDTAPGAPVNAAIVFLIEFLDRPIEQNHREMMRFNRSLWLLYENFIQDYPYPILIFHEPAFTPYYQKQYRRMWPRQLNITFHQIEFSMPSTFPTVTDPGGLEALGLNPTNRRAFPGYNHMIHFFFKDIFQHPAVRGLEYYWRLDHDSMVESRVGVDVFRYMRDRGLRYGYRTVTTDALHVTNGMLAFFDKYRRDTNHKALDGQVTCAELSQRNCIGIPETLQEQRLYAPRMYYNNFEIVHIPTWQSSSMIELTDAVDRTGMIYWNRWGDAPLRYYSVNMILDVKKQVMEWCHLRYHHHKTFMPLCDLLQ